ncbi:MAG: GIY-YIG nuclease family protein [Calditrichaceae bacterium]
MDKKEKIRQYKETPTPAGVYRIYNIVNGKSFIGASPNIPGKLNGQKFQLELGSHPDKELQKEWKEFGAEAFRLETLDTLEPNKEPGYNPAEDLKILKLMWIEKLTAAGEPLYKWSLQG